MLPYKKKLLEHNNRIIIQENQKLQNSKLKMVVITVPNNNPVLQQYEIKDYTSNFIYTWKVDGNTTISSVYYHNRKNKQEQVKYLTRDKITNNLLPYPPNGEVYISLLIDDQEVITPKPIILRDNPYVSNLDFTPSLDPGNPNPDEHMSNFLIDWSRITNSNGTFYWINKISIIEFDDDM